jgi:DNA polymerase V
MTLAPSPDAPRLARPLFLFRVPAGFPSPAEDYVEGSLDLNEHLIQHKEATFFVRVRGDSMAGAGICNGDLLVVDRAREAGDGDIVIAVVDGELTVKRLYRQGGHLLLLPENPCYHPIEFKDGQELTVWGVVTSSIHLF